MTDNDKQAEDLNNMSFSAASGTETLNADTEYAQRNVDLSQLDSPEFQLQGLKKEMEALQQNYLRSLADLENFKKRAAKERSDLIKYQGERVIADLLEVMDNLDLAISQKDSKFEDLQTGLTLIHRRFREILEKWGVSIVPTLGKEFDPQIQEALTSIEDPSCLPNTVLQEIKKAYNYKDKLLRPGQVIVSKTLES